ncbi:MAG TPA: MscL family protein, partial [Pseudonocardia sp.]
MIDLSVAVIMGAAFGSIVTAFTDKIVKPMLNAVTPPTSPGMSVQLVPGKESTLIDFASLITTVLNFATIAAVVYFVIVLPMKKIQDRRKRGEESGPIESTDIELLTEIRDLLRGGPSASSASSTSSASSASSSAAGRGQPGPADAGDLDGDTRLTPSASSTAVLAAAGHPGSRQSSGGNPGQAHGPVG